MNVKQFEEEFNQLKNDYTFFWEWNSDLEALADGMLFYRNEDDEKPFCGVVGVGYGRDGKFGGDMSGFMKILKSELKDEFGK